ncbi:hypothetical protein COY07_04815 [Candidatus Peregrinibacteria bacterium CG_4_10_14_0_2_um_filter_43_11]|nr:MAG: hypothetical protein COY07_04815 [Candidatus Peregrinibacteria bacterium CG_4_10_14_0_2_um_filter_43_11]
MEHITPIASPVELSMNRYFAAVYKWMTGALVISTLVAWKVSGIPGFAEFMAKNSGLFFGLVILQLVSVIALAGWSQKMSALTASLVFLGYSALTGLTLSTIFLIYTAASIAQVFIVTAGMFAVMSAYGYFTKKDLTGWGSFLFMSLIGLIIASLVNMFMNSHFLTWVTTYAGIIIFVGLTAYDTQKLKRFAHVQADDSTFRKLVIIGALTLYLDFINLFLHLLRAMGDRR